jgi:hypothetical protein
LVPRLALRNTATTDRVVAPYASVMAVTPRKAIANLHALEELRCTRRTTASWTPWISPSPTAADRPLSEARPHAGGGHDAHHRGMSLVALCS